MKATRCKFLTGLAALAFALSCGAAEMAPATPESQGAASGGMDGSGSFYLRAFLTGTPYTLTLATGRAEKYASWRGNFGCPLKTAAPAHP